MSSIYDLYMIMFVYVIGVFTGLLVNKAYRELLTRTFNKMFPKKDIKKETEISLD